jgi:hypothetical protein
MGLLVGCALLTPLRPSSEEIFSADYGIYPDNYKEIVTSYISEYLIDPDSAKYSDWKEPSRNWYSNNNNIFYGYRVCVYVNAKNRLGGYGGKKLFYFLINDNKIIVHDGGNYLPGTQGEDQIYNLCE